jgi:hypothetical protein
VVARRQPYPVLLAVSGQRSAVSSQQSAVRNQKILNIEQGMSNVEGALDIGHSLFDILFTHLPVPPLLTADR